MTVYEQIERGIKYLEKNLSEDIYLKDIAFEAGMSTRSFSDYFWAITGFTYKKYLIKRRLSESVLELSEKKYNILNIALNFGYSSNEAFSRSFKKEFNISPNSYRELRPTLATLDQIKLYKEKYMGVIVKSLNIMNGISFDGYGQNPENIAKDKLNIWLKDNPKKPKYRVFGHNINDHGESSNEQNNEGYRFLLITDYNDIAILPGKFVVTGIEGDFKENSDGKWINDGWNRLLKMIKKKKFKIKEPNRWYEEELQPEIPGNLRLDLYIEIE
jgi:AraC-like DNA-binding protein